MEALITSILDAFLDAGGPEDRLIDLYDTLAEKHGQATASAAWKAACNRYDALMADRA